MNLTGILLAGGRSVRLGMNKLKIRIGQFPLFIDQVFKLSLFCDEIILSTSIKNHSYIEEECKKIDDYFKYFYRAIRDAGSVFRNSDAINDISFKLPDPKIVIDDSCITSAAGPIAGIYSGIKNAANHYSFVLAFDMPFISFRLMKTLVDLLEEDISLKDKPQSSKAVEGKYDAFIIKTLKGFEVLIGIYSKNCMCALEKNIRKKDNKISNIFAQLQVRILKDDILKSRKLDRLNFFNINRSEDYKKFMNLWDGDVLVHEQTRESGDLFLIRWAEFFFR